MIRDEFPALFDRHVKLVEQEVADQHLALPGAGQLLALPDSRKMSDGGGA